MHFFPHNKNLHFLSIQGFCPPPLADMSVNNVIFFYSSPNPDRQPQLGSDKTIGRRKREGLNPLEL